MQSCDLPHPMIRIALLIKCLYRDLPRSFDSYCLGGTRGYGKASFSNTFAYVDLNDPHAIPRLQGWPVISGKPGVVSPKRSKLKN